MSKDLDARHRAVARLAKLVRDRTRHAAALRRRGVEPPTWLVESVERHTADLHHIARGPIHRLETGQYLDHKRLPVRSLTFGTVVYANVPFTGGEPGAKWRPAVVVSVSRRSVTVCPITSSTSPFRPIGAYPRLVCWEADGLIKPSFLKPEPVTIGRLDVSHVLGHLQNADRGMFGWLELPGAPLAASPPQLRAA